MYKHQFTKQAAKDAKNLKSAGLDKKAKEIANVVAKDPFSCPPAFEPLVGSLQDMYSRRINRQHRFVYEVIKCEFLEDGVVYEGVVKVLSMWSHYQNL
jgi:toxin YoeB